MSDSAVVSSSECTLAELVTSVARSGLGLLMSHSERSAGTARTAASAVTSTGAIHCVAESPLLRYVRDRPEFANMTVTQKTKERGAINAFRETLTYLHNHPKHREDVRNYVKELVCEGMKAHRVGADESAAGTLPETIGKYDENFIVKFVSQKLGITVSALGKARAKDGNIHRNIFRALMCCSEQVRCP